MKKPSAEQKDILNQEEAIVYFGLSRRKFYKLLKEGKGRSSVLNLQNIWRSIQS